MMCKLFDLFVIILAILPLVFANKYCNITCRQKNAQHTMCQYPSEGVSKSCGHVDVAGLNPAEGSELLQIHNSYRAFVASGKELRGSHGAQPGGRIPELTWDPELASIAQRWANQCNIQHDKCKNVDRFAVNQNLAWNKWTDRYHVNFTDFVQGWYDEVVDFNRNFVANYQSTKTAVTTHYSQLVWAATTHVGCGFIKYRENGAKFCTLLVCNYGPMGNLIGQRMY